MDSSANRGTGKIVILIILLLMIYSVVKQSLDEGWYPARNHSSNPPSASQAISQISCMTMRIGDKVSAANFKNTSGRQLDEVNVTFIFKTEDANDVTVKRYWLSWVPDETKEISLQSPIFIEKFSMSGTCAQGRLDASWLGGAKEDKRGFDPESQEAAEEQGKRQASLSDRGYTRDQKAVLISRQTEKVKQLQDVLTNQYKELDAKRSKIQETGQIAQYNKEAAEYATHLQELRNEEAFLKGLSSPPPVNRTGLPYFDY